MIIPEIEAALTALDEHVVRVIPALQALPQDERVQQSVAFSLGLAMRLTTFGLGPIGQIHPKQIQSTAMAIMETIQDIERDLWPTTPTSEN